MYHEKDKTMKNTRQLPSDYVLKESYDLKDSKLNFKIQIIFMGFAGLSIALMPIFNIQFESEYSTWLNIGITLALVLVYMSIHELTHGLLISLLSKTKSKYRIRFPFLTTGTDAFLNKKSFIIVCLGPSVIWGIVIIVSLFLVPQNLFLSFYILLVLNFAGSAGDYLQVHLVSKSSQLSLIKDDGTKTNIYEPVKKEWTI